MPDKVLIIFLFHLFIITGGGTAYAQVPPQEIQQEDTQTDEDTQEPELPIKSSAITVENNQISAEFVNVNFGEIIKEISKKAGFSIEGSSSVFSKNVTTRFKDLEIDSGVMRLLSLVKESNYRIDYDTKGAMSKLKIYNIKPGVSTPQTQYNTGGYGTPQSPASPQVGRSRRQRLSSQPVVTAPPQAPAAPRTPVRRSSFRFRVPGVYQAPEAPQIAPPVPTPEPEVDTDNADEPTEQVDEIPYTPN